MYRQKQMYKMKLVIILWAAILAPLAHADTQIEPYPSNMRLMFTNNCSEEKQAYCTCLLDKAEQQVPFKKFISDIQRMGAKFLKEHPYTTIGIECNEMTKASRSS